MTIGEVADHLSINVQTLRFYERKGLLNPLPRTQAGYRQFDESAIRRLVFIRHAQEVGFTLKEIRELLQLRAASDGSCLAVKDCAKQKIEQLAQRMSHLQKMTETLERLVVMCSDGLSATDCPILEALDETEY